LKFLSRFSLLTVFNFNFNVIYIYDTGKSGGGSGGRQQATSSSVERGTTLSTTNLPSTPIYLPQNGVKEKSAGKTTFV